MWINLLLNGNYKLNTLPNFIFDLSNIRDCVKNIPSYRYSQIADWVYKKNVFSPAEMKNIPLGLRNIISEKYIYEYPKIVKQSNTSDKTIKYLVELFDGEKIEFVLIKSDKRNTFCLSSQVGCPVRCKFCASGTYGLARNLFSGEIIAQFILGNKLLGKAPDNVVFMGIGEPLLNCNNLIRSLDIICSNEYIGYAARRITISTSGIPKGIMRLADQNKQWNLAVSLHAPDDIARAKIIPDKCRFSINEIVNSCCYYFEKTGRLITFEYTLIEGVNDSLEQADRLCNLLNDVRGKVNLIPYNQVIGVNFKRPSEEKCVKFANRLRNKGVSVTFRIEKGTKINAACGQLRASNIDNKITENI